MSSFLSFANQSRYPLVGRAAVFALATSWSPSSREDPRYLAFRVGPSMYPMKFYGLTSVSATLRCWP